MAKSCTMFYWLLLILGPAAAQTEEAEAEGVLPNWLTGIIAVAVFLFLVFIAFLVNKAWCETQSKAEAVTMNDGSSAAECPLDTVRGSDEVNTYKNVIVHHTDEKVTSM